MTTLTISIIIFTIGFLCLLFGNKNEAIYDILGFICIIAAFTTICLKHQDVKIKLPEEYQTITTKDTLKGYYDKNKVLHIQFNNKKKQFN